MEFDGLSCRVIGCAIEVHRELGPGLLESTYEQCLAQGLSFIPRVEKEYGEDSIVVVKEAIGGRPIRMWLHDWEATPGWKVDPAIAGAKPPKQEESRIGKQGKSAGTSTTCICRQRATKSWALASRKLRSNC